MYLVYEGREELGYPTNESLSMSSIHYHTKYDGISVRGLMDGDNFTIERRYHKWDAMRDVVTLLDSVNGGIFRTGLCQNFGEFYGGLYYGRVKGNTEVIRKMKQVQDKIEFCNNDDGDSEGPNSDSGQAETALAELKTLIINTCKEV